MTFFTTIGVITTTVLVAVGVVILYFLLFGEEYTDEQE